jgi:hypothetical protein
LTVNVREKHSDASEGMDPVNQVLFVIAVAVGDGAGDEKE